MTDKASAPESFFKTSIVTVLGSAHHESVHVEKNGIECSIVCGQCQGETTRTFQKTPLQNMMVNRMSIINMLFLNN